MLNVVNLGYVTTFEHIVQYSFNTREICVCSYILT